jgi:hypothetical protein
MCHLLSRKVTLQMYTWYKSVHFLYAYFIYGCGLHLLSAHLIYGGYLHYAPFLYAHFIYGGGLHVHV